MDILSLLLQLIFRAIVVVLPLTVGWLAFRRLMLSQSTNAWIYATVCLFAAVTSAGLIPWTLGLGSGNWLFFLFSAISPAVWMSVIMVCDPQQNRSRYDIDPDDQADVPFVAAFRPPVVPETRDLKVPTKPLILEEPEWPDSPVPMFRHATVPVKTVAAESQRKDEKLSSLLSIAREMRGNVSSDPRRPRMLPSPIRSDANLPFLNRG